MKKLLLVIGFLTVAIFLHSDEFLLFAGDAYVYNDVFKNFNEAKYAFKYDDKDEVFYLFVTDIFNKAWIVITPEQLAILRNNLAKYIEWEKTAIANKVKIEKEIPNSAIKTKVVWQFGDEWYKASNLSLSFVFFSQSIARHQLVIDSNKVKSSTNEFVTFKLDAMYFEKNQVLAFIKGISEEFISAEIKEYQNKKSAEKLFQ